MPKLPIKDSRGTEIKEGQKVAYNRSGDVIEGTVVNVQNSYVKIMPDPAFFSPFYGSVGVSRVRNRRSILVLT